MDLDNFLYEAIDASQQIDVKSWAPYFDHKRVWHYGTELAVADTGVNGGRGTRDIIILSAKTLPANMPMGPIV